MVAASASTWRSSASRNLPSALSWRAPGAALRESHSERVEAGHDLPRLLFLEAAFAGVAVDQISLLAQGRPLGRGGVVGLVLDHVLLARVDADRLGLDTRALGPLRLGAGAERAQQALSVGEIFEGQKRSLIELAGMEMEFVVLDVEDIAAHAVAIAVTGLFRQLLEELGVRNVALGDAEMGPLVAVTTGVRPLAAATCSAISE